MNQHTPAQLNAIRTWTEERDSLRQEIGTLSTERDDLRRQADDGLNALNDINNRIAKARGRILELEALEERVRSSVPTDIAELEARKSRLEAECIAKEAESDLWDVRIAEKMAANKVLTLMHDKMSDQATIVDQVVGQVIETSKKAVSDMKGDMAEVRTVVLEVIEKGNENVKQTNVVIDGLPKFIFEMQKPIPIRRKYPEGHPYHESDTPLTVIKES